MNLLPPADFKIFTRVLNKTSIQVITKAARITPKKNQ